MEASEFNEQHICYGIIMNIIIVLGTIGNILAIIVWLQPGLRNTTTATYLTALSIADLCVLWTAIFRYETFSIFWTRWDYFMYEVTNKPYIDVYLEPFHWIALGTTSMLTVALTVERFLAVKFPMKIKPFCNKSVTFFIIILILITALALTIPNFFDYKIISLKPPFLNQTINIIDATDFKETSHYTCFFHSYIIPIFWYLIPWVCLAVCNALLIHHVRMSARRINAVAVHDFVNMNPHRHLTRLLIAITITYMVCNLPLCVIVIIHVKKETENDVCEPGSESPWGPDDPYQVAR
ncbi:unnamed protein product, partial [Owenia fusiformis]